MRYLCVINAGSRGRLAESPCLGGVLGLGLGGAEVAVGTATWMDDRGRLPGGVVAWDALGAPAKLFATLPVPGALLRVAREPGGI